MVSLTQTHHTPRGLGRTGQAVALAILGALLICHVAVYFNFSEDDPGISFRYAAHLAEGEGLVYNPGERVEGYSNFGHVVLLSCLYRFVAGGDRLALILVVKLTNLIMAMACLVLFFRLLNGRLGALHALTASTLLVAAGAFSMSIASALETTGLTLLMVLTAGAAADYLRSVRPGSLHIVGLVAVLTVLALWRIDAPWLVALVIGFLVFERRGRLRRSDLIIIGSVAAAYAGYTGFRLAYFGELLPNTFHAKIQLDPSLSGSWPYISSFLAAHGTFLVIVPAVIFGFFARTRLERLSAFLVSGQFLFVALVQGDWIPGFRFFVPILPFLTILAARLALFLLEIKPAKLGRALLAVTTAVACTGLVIMAARHYVKPGMRKPLSWLQHPTLEHAQLTPYSGIARWIDATFSADASLALAEGGFIPYLSDRYAIDTFGLCTPEIAHLENVERSRWGVRAPLNDTSSPAIQVVLDRRPDALIFAPRMPKGLPPTLHDDRYELVKIIPVNQFAGGLAWTRSSPLQAAIFARRDSDAFLEGAFFRGPVHRPFFLHTLDGAVFDDAALAGGSWRHEGPGPGWIEGTFASAVRISAVYIGAAGSETAPETVDLDISVLADSGWQELVAIRGQNIGLTLDGTFDDSLVTYFERISPPLTITAVRVELGGDDPLILSRFGLSG